MIHFAIVVGIQMTLIYVALSCGMILSAHSTINTAAADSARSSITAPVASAEAQAGTVISWMAKDICATTDTTLTCNAVGITGLATSIGGA